MEIRLNGQAVTLAKPLTVAGLVEMKGLNPVQVIIQYNGNIVDRLAWSDTQLQDGDQIEILRFVGGG